MPATTTWRMYGGCPGRVGAGGHAVLIVHTIGCAAFAAGADGEAPVSESALRAGFTSGLRWLLDGIVADAGAGD
jgi:hypothetical protein